MKTTELLATICSFPNITPINTVEEGITSGNYNDHYSYITNQTVPLTTVTGAKTICLVCFNETIGETEWVERLRAMGKQPCRNAPQYLLGLMAQVPEDKMPPELRNKDLVAAEENTSSVFTGGDGYRCFRYVGRRGGRRGLRLLGVYGEWDGRWAFPAEDLVS